MGRPRKTVDYFANYERWKMVSRSVSICCLSLLVLSSCLSWVGVKLRTMRPTAEAVPAIHAKPYDLVNVRSRGLLFFLESHIDWQTQRAKFLSPTCYPTNPSTSICGKYVHTSTNKIRCPVNVVSVRASPLCLY